MEERAHAKEGQVGCWTTLKKEARRGYKIALPYESERREGRGGNRRQE